MKKILLFASAILCACSAFAQDDYAEYFKVIYQGEEVPNDGHVYCRHYDDGETSGLIGFEAYIYVQNTSFDAVPVITTLECAPGYSPTKDEVDDMEKWGLVQLCGGQIAEMNDNGSGNCVGGLGDALGYAKWNIPSISNGYLYYQIHDAYFWDQVPEDYEATFLVRTVVNEPDLESQPEHTFLLTFTRKAGGVNDIIFDANAPVEYYNMQGMRVANPDNGLYIMRQGGKAVKIYKK